MTPRSRHLWLCVLAVSAWVGLCTIAAYGFVVWCE
jgi:nitrate reductase NapE component